MGSATEQICVPNISIEERRKRLGFGLIMAVLSLAGLAVLITARINPWSRLALFPLFAGAATGYFQWCDKT